LEDEGALHAGRETFDVTQDSAGGTAMYPLSGKGRSIRVRFSSVDLTDKQQEYGLLPASLYKRITSRRKSRRKKANDNNDNNDDDNQYGSAGLMNAHGNDEASQMAAAPKLAPTKRFLITLHC
jgi:hypothetical protein